MLLLQKPDLAGLGEFLKPLNEVVMIANGLTEGKPSEFFNHVKAVAGSLAALFWIGYTGKDCGEWNFCFFFFPPYFVADGFEYRSSIFFPFSHFLLLFYFLIQGMSLPIAHVEESWQMAEFYNNKVC